MREKDLQATIIEAAKLFKYQVYHTYDSRRSTEGFPDLVIAGNGRLFIWELKSQDGRVTDTQMKWLESFSAVTTRPNAAVIRPNDLDWCIDALRIKR